MSKLANYLIYIICFIIGSLFLSNELFSLFFTIIWMIALVLMFASGIYFTIKYKLLQLNFKKQIGSLIKKDNNDEISTFESLSMSLAARIGVGSLAGIALAIYIGGPGVVFWMWFSGIITSINSYVESLYGGKYQEKDYNNIYKGGPSFYIKKGLKDNKLAILYAIVIIFSFIGGFLSIQSNTIVVSIKEVSNLNIYLVSIVLTLATALIIFKDVKVIAKVSSLIVPVMALFYIGIGIYIVINNINIMPSIFMSIIKEAFSLKGGIFGLLSVMILGIQRGIFANESGIGTSAIAASTSKFKDDKPALSQLLGINFTNLVICTITALIILTSNYSSISLVKPNGIEITTFAFQENLGSFGSISLCIVTILFAFSTIISGYYYGEASLKFIRPNLTKKGLTILKIIAIILLFLGCFISATFIWKVVDLMVAILAIINIYAIMKLSLKK